MKQLHQWLSTMAPLTMILAGAVLLAIALVGILGPSMLNVVLALVLVFGGKP